MQVEAQVQVEVQVQVEAQVGAFVQKILLVGLPVHIVPDYLHIPVLDSHLLNYITDL